MNESLLGTIFDNAAMLIIVIDRQGRVVRFNKACERVTGFREADLLGEYFWVRLLPAEEAAAVSVLFGDMIQTADGSSYINNWCTSDGGRRLIEWNNSTISAQGQVTHIIAIGQDITELKQERILGAKKAAALESSLSAVAIAEMDGTVSYANTAFVTLWGYQTHGEVVGRNAESFWGQRDDAKVVMNVLMSAGQWIGEIEGRRQDDATFLARLSANVVRDKAGTAVCLMFSFLDATALHAAEEAVTRSRHRYEALFNAAMDGIAYADIDTMKFISANPRWLEMMGYRADEVPSVAVADIHPREMREMNARCFSELAQGARDVASNVVVLRKDGSRFVADIAAVRIEVGGKTYLAGFFRDITERLQAEQKLRQWAAAFEHTVEGVIITDADSSIIDVNPAFLRLSGYSREEIIGQRPSVLRTQFQNDAFYRRMWHEIKAMGSWQGEIWNRRKSGEISPEWLTITSLKDGNGRVSNYVGVYTDISALKESQQRLEYLANHDPLTNLPNRVLLSDRISQAMRRLRRSGHHLAVMFIDLDRFKIINDNLGHPVGDGLLIQVAQRLQQVLRESDTVGRLGGDEFLVIIEDFQTSGEIDYVAEKVIEALTERFIVNGHELYIGASIGISLGPDNGNTPQLLIQNADAAMYKAKNAGRNTFHYYSSEITELAERHHEMKSELRSAFGDSEFEVFYQAKVDLLEGRIIGAEALLRWNSPRHGLVPPDAFIALTEENGLINSLGAWILHEACATLAEWQRQGYAISHVAVNVSGLQIQAGDLVETVRSTLGSTGLRPDALEIDITESVLISVPEKARKVLMQLHEYGVRLALDDFGTGYSALSNLRDYPFTSVKIDRTFIQDIYRDNNNEAVIKAVLAMGRSLNMEVVAEGVSSREQELFLGLHGCHLAQGHLYGKPLPKEQFEASLRAGLVQRISDSSSLS